MDDCCSNKAEAIAELGSKGRRGVLVAVLFINLAMFVVEFGAGLAASSTALMADSVDMLGDASVYALSLYAFSRGTRWKAGASLFKGVTILTFGCGIVIGVAQKIVDGTAPLSGLMAIFGAIALVANLICLRLLWSHRLADVNMSSTYECSRNDVIANVGVLLAAGGVYLTNSGWPDIVVGGAVALLFLRSGVSILREAWPLYRQAPSADVS